MAEDSHTLSIIHVDMDAFYASVEQLDNPSLKGKPVIVGGSVESRGVVSAASYEARKFGVHSAMPMVRARRLCPHAAFLPVRMARYAEVSRKIREIFFSFTPLVQPISLDEAFLDVAGSRRLFGPAEKIGKLIKERIRRELNLTASVGVASNKFLAKLASDLEKPDGFVVIRDEDRERILAPLPISRLWGVGPATEKELKSLGARTIGDVRSLPLDTLKERFGKYAETLHDLSRGIGGSEVVPDQEAKSISNETTFAEDISDQDMLESVLLDLSEEVAHRLRDAGLAARTVTVKMRFPDFRTITRSRTIPEPSNTTMDIFQTARELFRGNVSPGVQPLRLIGVGTSNFTRQLDRQLDLFDNKRRTKLATLDKTVDRIRKKLGGDSIKRGRLL